MSLITDPDLQAVLAGDHTDVDDLRILIDHITDKGNGRISLSSEVCKTLVDAHASGEMTDEVRFLIAEEVQRFGGHTIANLLRGGSGVAYKEILCDVANHVKAPYNPKSESADIEQAILSKVLEQALDKMDDEQKRELFKEFGVNYAIGYGAAGTAALITAIRSTGFAPYRIAATVANAISQAILGRGLAFGASATLMKSIKLFAGPIGWAITGIWTAFDLSSPAYRVTVPCVIQIAYMRQKALSKQCPSCETPAHLDAKFCAECGHRF